MQPVLLVSTILFLVNQILETLQIGFFNFESGRIGNDFPVLCGTQHLQIQRSPHTGLVEAGEPPVAEERLAVRKYVCPLVFWVYVLVQACGVVNERVLKIK